MLTDMDERLIIGITMGDPASIGPEITVKALADKGIYDKCRPLVIGDANVMEAAVKIVGKEDIKIHPVHSAEEALFEAGTIDVYDMDLVDMDKLERGKVSVMAGEAAFRYVEKVIQMALAGEVDGTVTNAFNKEAINMAGHHYSGHTEVYADMTGTKKYTMMLAHENIRVVHVSTHVSLREACDRVKKERVLEVIRIAYQACRDLGLEWQVSIPTAGRTVSSEGRRLTKSSRQLRLPMQKESMQKGRSRRIQSFQRPGEAGMIWWWPCTMTRGISH